MKTKHAFPYACFALLLGSGLPAMAIPKILPAAGELGDYPTDRWLGVGRLVEPVRDANNNITGFDPFCSGTLITPNPGHGARYVLTAAHCVSNVPKAAMTPYPQAIVFPPMPDPILPNNPSNIYLLLDEIPTPFKARSVSVFGGPGGPYHDIAIVELENIVPTMTYDVLPIGDEVGRVGELVGFGHGGNGIAASALIHSARWPAGVKREAVNVYSEAIKSSPLLGLANFLMFDFDGPGLGDGAYTGIALENEGAIANGDSGGPTFLISPFDGSHVVSGVHSFGAEPEVFGERFADARSSFYSPWIRANVPEPGTLSFLAIGGAGILLNGKSRRRSIRTNMPAHVIHPARAAS